LHEEGCGDLEVAVAGGEELDDLDDGTVEK
jgi:hypothetical protein